jgi:hypothetical protein
MKSMSQLNHGQDKDEKKARVRELRFKHYRFIAAPAHAICVVPGLMATQAICRVWPLYRLTDTSKTHHPGKQRTAQAQQQYRTGPPKPWTPAKTQCNRSFCAAHKNDSPTRTPALSRDAHAWAPAA